MTWWGGLGVERQAALPPPSLVGAEHTDREVRTTGMQQPMREASDVGPLRGEPAISAEVTAVELALCRSALYEALALGFRPPTAETVTRLLAREAIDALADAAAAVDLAWGTALAAAVGRLAGPLSLSRLQAGFRRLFGHTARGLVPPYETEYGEDSPFLPAHEMGDLAGFYRAFGLELRRDAHERPDHVSCQCEFMVVVTRREAYALEEGHGAAAEATRGAARLFLREHLGRWGPAFGQRLGREDPDGFYGALGALGRAFLLAECARMGVSPGPATLRLRSASVGNVPMACAAEPGVEAMPLASGGAR